MARRPTYHQGRSLFPVLRKLAAVALVPAVAVLLFQSVGCRQGSSPNTAQSNPEMTFPVRGKVVSTDATHVTLDHEAVPGFMEAMTMPYKLKDPGVVSELHPGDLITARIVV